MSQKANLSGTNPLPDEIQNVQDQTGNYDASHIICKSDGTIDVKGLLQFGYNNGISQIISQDNSVYVNCANGGDLFTNCVSNNITCTNMVINNIPSSQYFMVYGEGKDAISTQEQYHINFPDADTGQPPFNLRMFGYADSSQWFQNSQYNQPNNNFLTVDGDSFRFTSDNYMVEIEICFQLRYTFDNTAPASYFACGLFCPDTSQIVAQSLTWQASNDQKHKYQTFKTSFTMRTDTSYKYFPFYQQQDNLQWQDVDEGGRMRSWIKFKFYQFVTY